ncbi:MAG: BrnA antitoxin family protein [Rhodomicrobium sp.]
MKRKPTKTETSESTTARQAEIEALAALPDDEIDTSDIPEVRDWAGAKRGMFYRPIKRQLTLRIDADIVEWFKERSQDGKGYQTNINRALREYVGRHAKRD